VRICPKMESQRIENVGFVDRRPKRGDVRSLPQGSTEKRRWLNGVLWVLR
jgi:hypothetical protein